MLQIKTVSANGMAPCKRIEFWNEVTSSIIVDQVADPIDPISFHGCIRRTDLGDVRLAEVSAGPSIVTHSKAHICQSSEASYLLRLPLTGEVTVLQDDRAASLLPGDYSACDSARPYKLLMKEDTALLTLRIAQDKFQRYVGNPPAIMSHAMPGKSGASGLASHFIRNLWRSSDELQPNLAARLGEILMKLIGASYAALPRARVARSNMSILHRARITQFVEDRLADPNLTPHLVAAALNITPSYAHRIFSDAEPMGKYILRRRLEECARALVDPRHRIRSISSVAFSWGFNSCNYFSRAFRERYGLCPREYRNKVQR